MSDEKNVTRFTPKAVPTVPENRNYTVVLKGYEGLPGEPTSDVTVNLTGRMAAMNSPELVFIDQQNMPVALFPISEVRMVTSTPNDEA